MAKIYKKTRVMYGEVRKSICLSIHVFFSTFKNCLDVKQTNVVSTLNFKPLQTLTTLFKWGCVWWPLALFARQSSHTMFNSTSSTLFQHLTSIKNGSSTDFNFISLLPDLRELALGDCKQWNQEVDTMSSTSHWGKICLSHN